jgi:hypothetical protein
MIEATVLLYDDDDVFDVVAGGAIQRRFYADGGQRSSRDSLLRTARREPYCHRRCEQFPEPYHIV